MVETDIRETFSRMWDEIRGGNLYSGQPRTVASGASLSVAQRAIDLANSAGELAILGEAWSMMAYALNANENYPEAIEYYRRAIEQLERSGEHHRAARVRLGYIAALSQNGQCNEAIEAGSKTAEVFRSHDDAMGLAKLAVNLGTVYQRLDKHSRALECFNEAAIQFEQTGAQTALAQICLNVANSLLFLDRFDEAWQQFNRCEAIAQQTGMTDLWEAAGYNKTYVYVFTGRYSEALAMYVQLRQTFAKRDSRRHAALCDFDQCEIYLHLHLPHEAQILAERAIDALDKLGLRYEQAKALAFLGTALTQAGQFGEAQNAFRSAQDLFAAQGNELWKTIVQLYRAEVLFSLGRLWEAQSLAAAAQEAFARLNCPAKQIVAIVLLGKIALDTGRLDEAEIYAQNVRLFTEENPIPLFSFACHALCAEIAEKREDFATAKLHYELAAQEFQKRHTHLHHDELGIAFFKGKQEIYEALVEHSLGLDGSSDTEQAFSWCEKAKSQTFVDLLRNHVRTLRSQADVALLDRVHRMRDELNASYLRFRPELRTGASQLKANEIDLKEEQLIRALDELSKTDSEYVSLHEVVVSKLSDVQAVIPPKTTIVEYFIAGDEILAFLIDGSTFKVCRHVSPVDRVLYLAGQIRQQVNRPTRAKMDRVLNDLYRELIAPFIKDLDASRLIVIPHGLMSLLPFHAFFDGTRYLCEYLDILTLPSASVFDVLSRRSAVRKPSYPIRHIPGDVILRQENPLLSSIEFPDRVLSTPDIYSLRCDADVVALTGQHYRTSGSVTTSDDLIGLVRGFLYAGASSVVTRLWNNPPAFADEFLNAFTTAWNETGSREAAMQHARRFMKDKNDHPYYWACFTMWGGA